MKAFIVIFISLIIFSCDKKSAVTDLHIKEVSGSKHQFRLKYNKKDSTETIILKELEIKDIYTKKTKQVINLDTIEVPVHSEVLNITQDVNFDGHDDIQILNYEGSYNSCYSFWLYNNSTDSFDHYKRLDGVNNPVILKETKEICSKYRIGLSEFYFEKYFWENNTLILKEKYKEFWSDKGILRITKLTNEGYMTNDSIILERMVEKISCK